jgi:hypothetical protein
MLPFRSRGSKRFERPGSLNSVLRPENRRSPRSLLRWKRSAAYLNLFRDRGFAGHASYPPAASPPGTFARRLTGGVSRLTGSQPDTLSPCLRGFRLLLGPNRGDRPVRGRGQRNSIRGRSPASLSAAAPREGSLAPSAFWWCTRWCLDGRSCPRQHGPRTDASRPHKGAATGTGPWCSQGSV